MSDSLEQGRTAYEESRWDAAYQSLARANARNLLDPRDLWRLALAAYLTGRDAEFIEILERAHQAWLATDDLAGAARCGFWIGFALIDRGEMARASGWFQRAGRLLDRMDGERVERGYLLVPSALRELTSGDAAAAFRTAGEAVRLALQFDDADLLALALHLQGRALLEQQRVSEGLALLDEAMVGVSSGEATPLVTGLVYCSVIGACRRVYAVDRAHEWTAALTAWCERQPDLVPYRGLCLVYRAEIMQLHGAWQQSFDEAARVIEQTAPEAPPAMRATCGAARYQQGEVYRLRGALAEAEVAYRESAMLGREPQPGLALLRLAQGDANTAHATIQRALAESRDAAKRARLLPAAVDIALASGDVDAARAACVELSEIAASFGAAMLDALATHAHGAVALADGDALAALIALRRACNAWQRLDAPWEEARTRTLLARACRELGDLDAAALEVDAARNTFARIGAGADVACIDPTATCGPRSTSHAASNASASPANRTSSQTATSDLTRRELEVLSLLATGMTNRTIAERLYISEKTVARHVSNIFMKLDVATRSAATAHAYEHGLVQRAR